MAATVKIDFRIGDPSAVARSLKGIVAEAKKAAQQGANEGLAAERRAAQQSMALAKQAAAAKVRETNAAAKSATAAIGAEARRQVAIEQAASRERIAMANRESKERIAREREIGVAKRAAAYQADKLNRASGGSTGRVAVEGAAGGVRRALGGAAVVGGIVGGAVGTAGIVEALKGRVDLESKAASLAADVHEKGGKFMDRNAIVKQAQGVAGSTGIAAGDVIDAMSIAAGSGGGKAGLDAFVGSLESIGQLAVASGSKMEDWALISAELTNNGVTDAKKQMEIMRSIVAGGKAGNINARQMAGGVGAVMGAHQAGSFEGSGEKRARQASALIQLARSGGAKESVSAEDSVTAARNLYNDLGSHEKIIKKMGVKTTRKNAKGEVERVDAIEQLGQLFDKTGGDITKMDPAFGMQSQAVFGKLLAEWKKGGGKNGGSAAMKKIVEGFEQASMSEEEVKMEAAVIMDTASKKIAVSMEQFSAKMSDELMPVLAKAIPQFAKLSEAIVNVTKFAVESPATAAASFVALSAAAGGAQAVLGRLGSGLLDSVFKSATTTVHGGVVNVSGGAGSGGIGGAGGKAGMLGGAIAAATVGFAVGAVVGEGIDKKLDVAKNTRTGMWSEALNLSQKIKGGTATQADMARAEALKTEIKTEQDKGVASRVWEGATAGARGVADGQLTAANILSLIPPIAVLRGAFEGANGTSEANADSKIMAEALATLSAASAKPTQLAPGTTLNVVVTNAADLRQAANTQGPQAQLPP